MTKEWGIFFFLPQIITGESETTNKKAANNGDPL